LAVALAALWLPAPAGAQVGATLGLASDYRLRGLSLSDYRPALTFSLAYDRPISAHLAGAYAGGTIIADADGGPYRLLGTTEYAGFTRSLGGGLALDAGASYQHYTLHFANDAKLHYAEFYLGAVWRDVSVHLYLKPGNPRRGVNSAYQDINWTLRPVPDWRVSAHFGANERLNGSFARDGKPRRYDAQLALARAFAHAELEATWTASAPGHIPHAAQTRPGVAIGARYFF
jgi:uncharacterized protein (TIGR02001 family)